MRAQQARREQLKSHAQYSERHHDEIEHEECHAFRTVRSAFRIVSSKSSGHRRGRSHAPVFKTPPMADSPSSPPLASAIFDWTQLPVVATPVGVRRAIFDATTRTMRNLECHATTLNPGETAHPPHRHPDEELVIVKDGTLDVTIEGSTTPAPTGSVVFFRSQDLHGMRNPGPASATYHVIRFATAETPA